MKLQTFKNCKDKSIDLTTSPESWIEEIKNGYSYKNFIQEARIDYEANGKLPGGIYEQIKANKLPVITWNFLFDKYKKNSTATISTGYLYFDIDSPGFEIELLDKSNIYSFFKSLSLTGYGIVVRVNGVTTDNFKAAYKYVADQLGILSVYDTKAASIDRNTVLTYDPDCYFNPNSSVIEIPTDLKVEQKTRSKAVSIPWGESIRTALAAGFSKVKIRDAEKYYEPSDLGYTVFKNKIDTVELVYPKPNSIRKGRRNIIISALLAKMLYLNPSIKEQDAYNWIYRINEVACMEPLENGELNNIFDNLWKNVDESKIKKNKKRRIVFDPLSNLTKEQKCSIGAKENGRIRREETKEKIYQFVESYVGDSKITAKFVSENIGVSLRTVETYWSEFKEFVKEKNKTYDNRATKKTQKLEKPGKGNDEISGGIDSSMEAVYTTGTITNDFLNAEGNAQTNCQTLRDINDILNKP